MSHVTKNYSTDGGDTLVIGGKLVVEEDATVEGLNGGGEYTLPTASSSVLDGVKVGSNLSIDENGVLSASTQIASSSVLGGVRVGSGLNVSAGGTLSAAPATADVAGAVKKMPFQGRCAAISLVEVENSINGILQKLQAAGLMAPEE